MTSWIRERIDATLAIAGSTNFRIQFPVLVLFLTVVMLPIYGPSPEEEAYFQESISQYTSTADNRNNVIIEKSNARFLTEFIIRSVIQAVGYEEAQIVLRLLQILIYSVGLSVLLASFGLRAIESLAVLSAFMLAGQNLIGGDWIFRSVEGKTFAYSVVFVALAQARMEHNRMAIVLTALATYFHFLVGGFWALVVLGIVWHRSVSCASVLRNLALYVGLISPILAILIFEHLAQQPLGSNLSSDYIYSAIRNSHHVAPFISIEKAIYWSDGIVVTVALFAAFLIIVYQSEQRADALFIAALLAYLIVALLVSYIDKDTLYFGKFYLFRPSSVILLLALVVGLQSIRNDLLPSGVAKLHACLGVFVIGFLWNASENQVLRYKNQVSEDAMSRKLEERHLVDAVSRFVPEEGTVFIEPFREMHKETLRLHRIIERATYVSWKLVPTTSTGILEWYARVQHREQLFGNPCRREMKEEMWIVTLTQSAKSRAKECGTIIWEGDVMALLQLNDAT